MKTLVVRFRGIGDVLISWFGLETLARETNVYYCTSPSAARLFPNGWVDIVPYQWENHPLNISPTLPEWVMQIPHNRLINLVNAVDFRRDVPDYDTMSRARQFARLMGVVPSDYVRPIIRDRDYLSDSPVVLCQTDAKAPTRRWAYWDALSVSLMRMGCYVLWCGDTRKEAPQGVDNRTATTQIEQWLSLLSSAHVIVSACTSAVHIGARMPHVKVVGLYGSTDYRIFTEFYTNVYPIMNYSLPCAPCADWQRAYACYQKQDIPWCLNLISPYYVAKKIIQLIEEAPISTSHHHPESGELAFMGS